MPTLESSEWLELWRAVVHALGSGRSLFVFPFGSLFGVQADLKVRLYDLKADTTHEAKEAGPYDYSGSSSRRRLSPIRP